MSARIPDIQTLIQAGINPKTGLPIKLGSGDGAEKCELKNDIKRALRVVDEQNAINRYKWYNLPSGITSQMLERILYYRGQGMFFYMDTTEEFYFLPYALDGTIDVYGRFQGVTPLPFNGTASAEKDGKQKPWITGLNRKPVYEVIDEEELDFEMLKNSCVLLSDYSNQQSQTNISRQILQEPLLDVMSECLPLMRTALINSTGITGQRVNDDDAAASVAAANNQTYKAAISGKRYIPVTSQIEFQDLAQGEVAKSEEFLIAMQSLDNLRLSLYGLDNGGLFEKKAHMLEAEQEVNNGNVGLVYQDGLTLRQRFCDIVNSIWDLGIYCDSSETVVGMDKNLDGEVSDTQDQSGTMEGEQPGGVMSNE